MKYTAVIFALLIAYAQSGFLQGGFSTNAGQAQQILSVSSKAFDAACHSYGVVGSVSPMMGCGGEKCPAAVAAFDAVNIRMVMTMAIAYTGHPDVDFVRGMIPHHEAAIEMCDVLVHKLPCGIWENKVYPSLVQFCKDVRSSQSIEVAGMRRWLARHGIREKAPCNAMDGMHGGMSEMYDGMDGMDGIRDVGMDPMVGGQRGLNGINGMNGMMKAGVHADMQTGSHNGMNGECVTMGMVMAHDMGMDMDMDMDMDMGMHMCMGCGKTDGKYAAQYIDDMVKMHMGMAIDYSCNRNVDFSRMMIPHHNGAVAMCAVLMSSNTHDAYLKDLCVNITANQLSEVAWLNRLLVEHGYAINAPCIHTCPGGKPLVPAPVACDDVVGSTELCHLVRTDAACHCPALLKGTRCGSTVKVKGRHGHSALKVAVDDVCSRSCGLCPKPVPLFHNPCPMRKGKGKGKEKGMGNGHGYGYGYGYGNM